MTPGAPVVTEPLRFRPMGWKRHCFVVLLMALLAAVTWGPHLDSAFAFDDEPNILRNPLFHHLPVLARAYSVPGAIRSTVFSASAPRIPYGPAVPGAAEAAINPDAPMTTDGVLYALWVAAKNSPAPNRPVTNLTFAWHVWRHEWHVGESYIPARFADLSEPEREAQRINPARDFRLWNVALHVACGGSVYLLLVCLLQLPRVDERLRRHAWPVAAVAAFLWFASPAVSTPVMYVVQRAVLLATLFSAWAMIFYFRFRAVSAGGKGWLIRAAGFLGLAMGALFLGVLSKEIAALVPLGLILAEYCLVLPGTAGGTPGGTARSFAAGCLREASACVRQAGLPLGAMCLPVLAGIVLYYGKVPDGGAKQKPAALSAANAVAGLWDDAYGKVFSDEPRGKTRITRRQRLLTQTRVVAMYQSLLLIPAPARLTLDYDFPETTRLMGGAEATVLPLGLVLCLFLAWRFSPPGWRGAGLLAAVLTAHAAGLESVWWRTWPVPAILWHTGVLGLAVWSLPRTPLLSFCVFWFYAGHLIESTVIGLELVFEHRMYLPGIAMYLFLTVALFDAIMRWSTRRGAARAPVPQP